MEESTLTTEQLAYRAGRDLEQTRALSWVKEIHRVVQTLTHPPSAAQALDGLVRNFEEATYRGPNPEYDLRISGKPPERKDGKKLTQQDTLRLLNISVVVFTVLDNLNLSEMPSKQTVSDAILAVI